MSVIIIGGNECMRQTYCEVCAFYGCQAKVFILRHKDLPHCFGRPDLCVLFTGAVSHTMVKAALNEAKRKQVPLARSRSGSAAALHGILQKHFEKRETENA